MHKLEHFSFNVACIQCGHPHSHQQVPFVCVALHVASCILCGLGLWPCHTEHSAIRVAAALHVQFIVAPCFFYCCGHTEGGELTHCIAHATQPVLGNAKTIANADVILVWKGHNCGESHFSSSWICPFRKRNDIIPSRLGNATFLGSS